MNKAKVMFTLKPIAAANRQTNIYNSFFRQLVKGGDIAKTLDMKGRERFVELVNVSNLFIMENRQN